MAQHMIELWRDIAQLTLDTAIKITALLALWAVVMLCCFLIDMATEFVRWLRNH